MKSIPELMNDMKQKCEAEDCKEWATHSVPTLFGAGYLCQNHYDDFAAAEREKWKKSVKEIKEKTL
jgi:hypothetical protein